MGQSTRHGGVSPAPFTSLNLGLHTDDKLENVMENRKRFFTALGATHDQTAGSYQVHGSEILLVEKAGQYEGYDALITNQKNCILTVTIADCVPVLIYDHKRKVVAAVHAGWRGTVAEIVRKTMNMMQAKFETESDHCYAYIGACIDESSFEVDKDVAQHFENSLKRWDTSKKKFLIDLKKANKEQLIDSGVPKSNIEVSPFSTVLNNEDFFSYRKEKGKTGRMLGAVGIITEN